jgi:hypothetical protein
MNKKLWSDVAATVGITLGINNFVEYFSWFWPSVLSHCIFLFITGAFALAWGILYFKTTWGRLSFTVWSDWTAVIAVLGGINSLIGVFWRWWAPPTSNYTLVLFGMCLCGWSLYHLISR